MRTVNSLIGSPIERLEDLRFLRGRGQYVDDLARKVVDVLAAAAQKAQVLHPFDRAADQGVDGSHCRSVADPPCW